MTITEILSLAAQRGAADIFIVAGLPCSLKINGRMIPASDERLKPADTHKLIEDIYELADHRDMSAFLHKGDDDFSFALPGVSRFRVSTYRQRGSLAAVVRVITFQLPDPSVLGITAPVIRLSDFTKGLILITGPAGSGKSTTLACIIDEINRTRENHIITLEDPLEYLHNHKKSIVSQREIRSDTETYVTALRAALRQSPDVILLGEMRDYETINVAMTAAETGHLVISTLHTIGAANTVDRIIDVFPPNQQHQIAIQLSMALQAVVSQQLVPCLDGSLTPAFEIMTVNTAIRNLIRDNKIHQIDGMIYSSATPEIMSMDSSLFNLYQQGKIDKSTALMHATNPDMLKRKLI